MQEEIVEHHIEVPQGAILMNIPHGGAFEILESASPILTHWVGPSVARVRKLSI
jgi:hypothetical protein